MLSFISTIIAITAALSVASASPLVTRDIYGAAPTGTTTQTPLAEPADITIAALCLAQCKAEAGCECFLFRFLNNVYIRELFAVPASSVPPVTDLVAYDIACPNVPNVVPTASNPTGVKQKRQTIVTRPTTPTRRTVSQPLVKLLSLPQAIMAASMLAWLPAGQPRLYQLHFHLWCLQPLCTDPLLLRIYFGEGNSG